MTPEQIQKMAEGFRPSCIGKDHEEVVVWLANHHIALQQQVNALTAEGAMMRQIIDSVTDLDNEPQYHDIHTCAIYLMLVAKQLRAGRWNDV